MRFSLRLNILVLVIAGLTGCDQASDDPPQLSGAPQEKVETPTGHQRMLQILDKIKQVAPREHQYFGRGAAEPVRKRVATLNPETQKAELCSALSRLGFLDLSFQESPRQAINELKQAYDLLDEATFRTQQEQASMSNRIRFLLGVAYLRLGETENCCLRHTAESCILPIRGEGVHTKEEGSREAIKYFSEVLEGTRNSRNRSDILQWREASRWLLNIAYMTLDEFPEGVPKDFLIPSTFFESEIDFPEFKNVGPKLNIDTFNAAGGAVVDDFDNDNYLDIFTSTSDPTGQTKYFRNNQDGTFSDQTEAAGLLGMYGGLNMVQADFNNDGNIDIFILRGAWHEDKGRHPNSLLRNNGNGTFTDVTFEAGLGQQHYPTKSASWADFDNDGNIDLFIANETNPKIIAPCQLFRNNGDETFTDVSRSAGVGVQRYSMGAVWGDFDRDRFPDLFIAGAPQPTLFRNRGNGQFEDVAQAVGISRPKDPFPCWFWDFNNDGLLDLYVSSSSGTVGVLSLDAVGDHLGTRTDEIRLSHQWGIPKGGPFVWDFEMPALFQGTAEGKFVEVAKEQNLTYPTEPMGANFGDLNGDGYLDFYLATGDVPYWELRPNVMFVNKGAEGGFANVTMTGGFGHLQKGHGVSFADIDNDGDQDVYVQMGGQLPGDKFNDALFENPGFNNRWLSVKLIGLESNKSGIGARIHVTVKENGLSRSIFREVNSGGSFGCNPLRQNIGLGKAEQIESLEIYWPTSDSTQTFNDVGLDQLIEIREHSETFEQIKLHTYSLGGTAP